MLLGMKLLKRDKKGAEVQQKIDPKHIHIPVENAALKDTSRIIILPFERRITVGTLD